MVYSSPKEIIEDTSLSVLALSSRFDGPTALSRVTMDDILSVLALSSRFDGPGCDIQIVSIP